MEIQEAMRAAIQEVVVPKLDQIKHKQAGIKAELVAINKPDIYEEFLKEKAND